MRFFINHAKSEFIMAIKYLLEFDIEASAIKIFLAYYGSKTM